MSERDMAKLLALIERQLGTSWLDISEWLRGIDANALDAIEARLIAFDFSGVVAEVESAARTFATTTHQAFTTAGQRGAAWLDKEVTDKLIRFDATGSRAVLYARQNELELVQGLSFEVKKNVSQVLADRAIQNPRDQARAIRESIGLTPHQEKHVRNYRQALREGNFANALGRELRDGRSDRTLRRLMQDGGSLSEAQIDKMVERYRANYLTHRAEVIATTEGSATVHAGLDESFGQAIERGDINADQLVSEWIPGPDTEGARADHRTEELLAQRPKYGQDFILGDGTRMRHPGDRRGGAKHCAGCRCTVAHELLAA